MQTESQKLKSLLSELSLTSHLAEIIQIGIKSIPDLHSTFHNDDDLLSDLTALTPAESELLLEKAAVHCNQSKSIDTSTHSQNTDNRASAASASRAQAPVHFEGKKKSRARVTPINQRGIDPFGPSEDNSSDIPTDDVQSSSEIALTTSSYISSAATTVSSSSSASSCTDHQQHKHTRKRNAAEAAIISSHGAPPNKKLKSAKLEVDDEEEESIPISEDHALNPIIYRPDTSTLPRQSQRVPLESVQCAKGHYLKHRSKRQLISEEKGYKKGGLCDGCRKCFWGGAIHCTECGYDLCKDCYWQNETFVDSSDALLSNENRIALLQCLPRLQMECNRDFNYDTDNHTNGGRTQLLIDSSLNVDRNFIPTIFEVDWNPLSHREPLITAMGEINNLFYWENQRLYQLIGQTFAKMLPMFANVYPSIRDQSSFFVIVQMQDHQIASNGGTYQSGFHHEGLDSDNICAVGIYCMEVSREYGTPILEISNNHNKTQLKKVSLTEGSVAVFTNQSDKAHRLLPITNNDSASNNSGNDGFNYGTRKILKLSIIAPNATATYAKLLRAEQTILNYRKKCDRVVNYWYRTECNRIEVVNREISRLVPLFSAYVCGTDDTVTQRKHAFNKKR